MKLLPALIIVGALGAIGVIASKLSVAQEQGPSLNAKPNPVPAGTYESFTTWQMVRLGATTLVNREVAARATVVNGFDGSKVIAAGESARLLSRIYSGELAVAYQKGHLLEVAKGLGEQAALLGMLIREKQAQSANLQKSEGAIKLLTTEARIGLAESDDQWIVWKPLLPDGKQKQE